MLFDLSPHYGASLVSRRFFVLALFVFLGFNALVSHLFAEEPFWPRFHGSDGTNISKDKGLLPSWPEEGPELVWTAEGIGNGYANVTIAEGRIFTAGNVGDSMVVTALDLDGKILWQQPNGPSYTKSYPGARGTPTIDGDRIYHESPTGQVSCFETATGKKIWTTNILEKFGTKNITWALAESVLIDSKNLIVAPCGPNTAVVALNKMTGKLVWKSKPSIDEEGKADLAGYATATLIEYKGIRMILTMTENALIGVDADGGRLLFRFPHETRYKVNATKPLYHDGHVCISSGYGTTGTVMVKLGVQGGKVSAEKVWDSRELDNQHGGLILYEGHIYGSGHKFNRGSWVCLDWKTGEMKYKDRGIGQGSATLAEGMLYTLAEKKRKLGLVKATPEGYELVSEFILPSGGKGPTWAHPVISGNLLYIRHGDFLYTYRLSAK